MMDGQEYVKTLDQIARDEGYLAAARVESTVATLRSIGLEPDEIEIIQTPRGVDVRVSVYRRQEPKTVHPSDIVPLRPNGREPWD